MNETWAFVYDVSTCNCFPNCSTCATVSPGTNLLVGDEQCLKVPALSLSAPPPAVSVRRPCTRDCMCAGGSLFPKS